MLQRPARKRSLGGVEGRRSHGDDLMKGTLGTTEGDGAAEDGDTGRDDRPMSPLDTDGNGDGGGAAVTSVWSLPVLESERGC